MLRVLYLANYAPTINDKKVFDVKGGGTQPTYHEEIFNQLVSLGLDVESSRDINVLLEKPGNFDYVFSLLNRAPYRGSEILVSALCEYFGLPYLGARPHVRAVAEDKHIAKIVARQIGFNVPKSKLYQKIDDTLIPPEFVGPYIAKPRCGASSKNLTESCIQDLWSDLIPEIHRLLLLGDDVLVEEFIQGINISLPVIGGSPPLIMPAYCLWSPKKGQLVTYEQKRHIDEGLVRTIFDNSVKYDYLRDYTSALYRELEPLDYLRVDFRMTEAGAISFLEFNVCCNIASKSGFYFCVQQTGLSYREMIIRILRHSFERQKIKWQPF